MQGSGRQWLDDANTLTANPWIRSDAKVQYQPRVRSGTKTRLYLGVSNIFNSKYVSMIVPNAVALGSTLPRYFYPGQGRSFTGGIEFLLE